MVAHRLERRRLVLDGLYDFPDQMVNDAREAGRAGGCLSVVAQNAFLSHVVRVLAGATFTWPSGRIADIARRLSSPGPHGLSCSLWGHRPPGIAELFNDVASDLTQGIGPPSQLLRSYTSLIPNAEHRGDADGFAARKAAELRLVVLRHRRNWWRMSSTGRWRGGWVAEQTVCAQERGFVRNRLNSDNVVEFEGRSTYMYTRPGFGLSRSHEG